MLRPLRVSDIGNHGRRAVPSERMKEPINPSCRNAILYPVAHRLSAAREMHGPEQDVPAGDDARVVLVECLALGAVVPMVKLRRDE